MGCLVEAFFKSVLQYHECNICIIRMGGRDGNETPYPGGVDALL